VFRAAFSANESNELFKLLDAAAPQIVLVHQLLGFTADFVARLGEWVEGRESVYYVHDFYPLCPRVTFIDATQQFCDVAPSGTCARCIAIGGAHDASRLDGLDPAAHRALFGRVLRGFAQVIAPSASAAAYLRRGFADLPVDVIPHAEPGNSAGTAARRAEDDAEIVLFGALGPHKGSGKLLEIARRAKMTRPALRFLVIGYTSLDEELLAVGNVRITGRYEPEMLPVLVAEAQGKLALFLHEWPETYSYTLSEAWRFGFVPLVPDIGAPAERVRELGFGVVYPFPADAEAILQVIEETRLRA
jgi:glycosyltransferase involved in cell wall biosynthesis